MNRKVRRPQAAALAREYHIFLDLALTRKSAVQQYHVCTELPSL